MVTLKDALVFRSQFELLTKKKICVLITGGGFDLVNYFQGCGASSILENISVIYGQNSLEEFTTHSSIKYPAVSKGQAELLLDSYKRFHSYNDVIYVICTAALTSDRWRRGANHACILVDDKFFEIQIPKLTEEEYKNLSKLEIQKLRIKEDEDLSRTISEIILSNV